MSSFFVSMPTFQTPPQMLDRAIRSVLAQTHTDLRLVVIADGHKLRNLPRDDRLIFHRLERNMGRYFCDAVVTSVAADDEIVVIHDADDWSEPDRFELLAPIVDEHGAAIAKYQRHYSSGRMHLQDPARHKFAQPDEHWVHIGHWCSGAYTGERIRRAGGIHPGFRVGFDTLFVRMIAYTGPVGISSHAAYHWQQRASGSLTTSPATRFRSRHREEAKVKLRELNRLAWQARRRGDDPGQVIRDDIPGELREQVEIEADRLRLEL